MKILKNKSSARIKKRYLLIEGERKDIEETILDYIGILGWAKASPFFLNIKEKNKIILAIDRKELVNIRASFAISNKPIRILRVSGTLKGLDRNL